jgi:hypothetical protein
MLWSIANAGEQFQNGKALYFDGKFSNGKNLTAHMAGGAVLQGKLAACVRCHRPSGYGINESDARTADITANTLFNPLEPRRDYLLRSLYQERHGIIAQLNAKTPRNRPAYQDEVDILKAVHEGVDTGGNTLSTLMPRYDIDLDDAISLKTFLQTLGNKFSPGVDAQVLHFATVVNERDSERKKAMLAVMHAFIKLHNHEVEQEKTRKNFSPLFKGEWVHARRIWKLHVWSLPDNRDNWPILLNKYYSEQPVFALLSGQITGAWKPIHNFCKDTKLPCLFPLTNWPETTSSQYTLYLSHGIPGEVTLIANKLNTTHAHKVLQVIGSDPNAELAAYLLEKDMRKSGTSIKTIHLTEYLNGNNDTTQNDSVILWFNANNFKQRLDSGINNPSTAIFAAGSLLVDGHRRLPINLPLNLNLSWQYSIPGHEPPRLFRLRGWLAARQIDTHEETTALNTYLALDTVRHALVHLVDRYSREYLIESIEHNIENALNPGIYPRLSLGPGQRFAAKDAQLIKTNTKRVSPEVITVH